MNRPVRGVLGTAIIWVLVWIPIALLALLLPRAVVYCLYCASFWEWFPFYMLSWGLWGGVSGAVFAIVLMLAERGHTLAQLSSTRVAGWGALGSLAFPAALIIRDASVSGVILEAGRPVLTPLILAAALGAACATGTVRLARRSQP